MPNIAPLAAVITKELLQTARDKRVIAILVAAPLAQLIIMGYAVNLDVTHVPTVVADEDHTAASRALTRGITAGDTFRLDRVVSSAAEGMAAIDRGEASAVVVLPRGLEADLDAGRPASLQVLTDSADSNRAIVSANALTAYATQQSLRRLRGRLENKLRAGAVISAPMTTVEPRILYNPRLVSAIYFVPGVAATLLLIVVIVVTAMGLAREAETGTLEQIMVTPIRPLALVAGKTLPYGLIGLVDFILALIAAMLLFDVPLRGDLVILLAGGGLYLMGLLGVGLFVSIIARNQQQAFMVSIFFIMPAILLSGFMTPVGNMPAWLQPATAFNPVRHMVEILRAVMLKGATWGDVLPQLTALAGLGVTLLGLAVVAMSRRLR